MCPCKDSNSDSSAIKPVASCYTNCVIPPPELMIYGAITKFKELSIHDKSIF
jgi:hypothetical protein